DQWSVLLTPARCGSPGNGAPGFQKWTCCPLTSASSLDDIGAALTPLSVAIGLVGTALLLTVEAGLLAALVFCESDAETSTGAASMAATAAAEANLETLIVLSIPPQRGIVE